MIDVSKIRPAGDAQARVVSGQLRRGDRAAVGRYPFGITLSPDDRTLLVTHVGVFQSTRTCGRPPRPAIRTLITRSVTPARATRTRRATIGPFTSRKSIDATCPTISAIPTASAAGTSRPIRRPRFPGWAARTRHSPRRSTCLRRSDPHGLDCVTWSRRGRSSASARTGSTSTAAAIPTWVVVRATPSMSPMATTTASRSWTAIPTRNAIGFP